MAANTAPDAVVLEGKGNSYSSAHNRVSAMTGRPTLLGWDETLPDMVRQSREGQQPKPSAK